MPLVLLGSLPSLRSPGMTRMEGRSPGMTRMEGRSLGMTKEVLRTKEMLVVTKEGASLGKQQSRKSFNRANRGSRQKILKQPQ